MWRRFFVYGFLGWAAEVAFTGSKTLFWKRDVSARAQSYLWMHPIYGLGGVTLEATGRALRKRTRIERALVGVAAIYGIEYLSGRILKRTLGSVPWDYGKGRFTVHGIIRLDYAPFWLGLAWFFEPLSRALLQTVGNAVEATTSTFGEISASNADEPSEAPAHEKAPVLSNEDRGQGRIDV